MQTRRHLMKLALATPFLGVPFRAAMAASPEIFNTGGVAIHGFDPVGYFDQSEPVEGSTSHQLKWMGAVWRFATPEHLGVFEMDPHRYAPQYGGYCAYAMSKGAVATTVPEAWTVYEGKLYLNFSTGVREIWQQDIPGHIAAADQHWPEALSG